MKVKCLVSALIQNLKTDFTVAPALLQSKVGIWVLNNSAIPAALVECGYMTNANDLNILKQNDKIETIAKNILQGVAMYANNKVDKSNLYQIENRDTIPSQSMQENKTAPLYIVDGKEMNEEEFKKSPASLNPNQILSINVWKDKDAIDKYGDKGKNGVIEITLKSYGSKDTLYPRKELTQAKQEPKFPGDNEGWKTYLENNLNVNILKQKNAPKGIYTVTVTFLVDDKGKVSDVKAIKNPGYGTADEAIRVIAKGPDWIPSNSKR